jgi:Zn-dependent protease with chaperone function
VIVRLMGEAQYRIDEALFSRLAEIDNDATAAAETNDEQALDRALDEMYGLVRLSGERLPDDELTPSDILIPPSDLTLDEIKEFLTDEGFVPDLPVPAE